MSPQMFPLIKIRTNQSVDQSTQNIMCSTLYVLQRLSCCIVHVNEL